MIISLRTLLSSLAETSYQVMGNPDIELSGLHWDPRQLQPGYGYFCLVHEEFQEEHLKPNSLAHWESAVAAGATCLFVEQSTHIEAPESVTLVKLHDLNLGLAHLSKAFWADPFGAIKTVGITGTNGKTTTCQILDSILNHAQKPTGVIGTIGTFYPHSTEQAGHLSNPLAPDLFRIGHKMKEEYAEVVMMEVTSHGMEFDRNAAIDFDIAIFTNLSQDHLDYHGSMKAYKEAKLKFIQGLGQNKKKALAIINLDDPYGEEFLAAVDSHAKRLGRVTTLTYGLHSPEADLLGVLKERAGSFTRFEIKLRGNSLCEVKLPMAGVFNVYNALAAFAAGLGAGVNIETLASGLETARQVSGRFEQLQSPEGVGVYVDYAHTPDALEKILTEVKGLTEGKVICVFGAGGDRDKSKRPIMGEIASRISATCIVTSDNPRTEDPVSICKEVVAGVTEGSVSLVVIEPQRQAAIELALQMANPQDSVLIAGKGHETHQIIGDESFPFSDRQVVLDYYANLTGQADRAVIEISLSVLAENLALVMADKPAGLKVMAVVKDDAIGHGMVQCAKIAVKGGVDALGVACLSEAAELREAGLMGIPILLFGERHSSELETCLSYDLSLQVQSAIQIRQLGELAGRRGKKVKVHLKIDSGMGRYGVKPEAGLGLAEEINGQPNLIFEGLMTHFAQSDEADKTYAKTQWSRFEAVVLELEKAGIRPPLVHACNSGGYLDLSFAHGDMIRTGALMTGVYPSEVCRRIEVDAQGLKPALSAKSLVAFVKHIEAGDSVGYGMHFKATGRMKVAVLPIGYGDGYPRLRNKGEVLIQGQHCPIIGGNSMDATMVDVSNLDEVQIGEEVVLIGSQGSSEITAMQLARWASTVTYQVLSSWSQRMIKRWV